MSTFTKSFPVALCVLALGAVAAGCGGGGGRGVSASSYVSTICPATSHFETTISAQEQQLQTNLPSLLSAAAYGGSSVMDQAKQQLLTFVDKSAAAAHTWQDAVHAAGTPDVTDGSTVAAALNDAAGKLVSAFATLRNDTNALPTTDPTAFDQAAQAALHKFQSSLASEGRTLQNLHNTELDSAAKQSGSCSGVLG